MEYLADHPRCECVINGHKCRKFSDQIHHKRGRGKDLCNKEFFMAVCGPCHNYIERHRAWAKWSGYLINRAAQYRI